MIWVMDSECCCNCGALLRFFETTICSDCLEDERFDEEQDMWWYEDEEP